MEKAAIIDDNRKNRERWGDYVLSIGFDPIIYDNPINSLGTLERDLLQNSIQYALCDHRLNETYYAPFLGAEAVARMYDKKVSALLITGYQNSDADTTIRTYRKKIPVLLKPEEVNKEALRKGFEITYNEIVNKNILPERQSCKAIMTITDVIKQGGMNVIKVVLIQWDINTEVGFPTTMLPKKMSKIIKPGQMLLADVNVDAEKPEDLFFENFSLPNDEILRTI